MPSQTGSIDLTSQVAANSNAIDVASKTATNYITADSNGIKIHMTDNSTTYQHQSATGTNFYVNSLKRSEVGGEGLKVYVGNTAGSETEVGHFGEYTRIGDIESSHTTISPLPNAGVAMYDETGSTRALRVATSGLYIGSDDTAHFSDDGFTLFPQGSDVGDVVRLNAGSIGTQRTNITRTIKLEANETLSTLSLSGAPTISHIYRNTTELVKGTDYIQQTTTNSGGVDWEYNSTKDGHYINTNIIFNPAITGPVSVIIECGVLVPQNYYMRMGPEWYNHTVIDDEGFRVINYNGDPVFNVDMTSDGTSSVTVGEADKKHMVLDADGLSAYDENGDYAEINGIVDGKNIKPNSVTANSINTENLVVGINQVESLSSSMAWQGTCATAAATAAKVVTCAGFTLNSGATITVRFTTANTSAAALSLNVNSTGAKTIYVAGAATAAANQLLWAANATISFTYDGTYWRVTGEPRNWYGACTIAATTAAKTVTINEVVLCKGSTINLQMTNANAVANPTLNITSLGAKDIYSANVKLTATSSNNWSAASTIPFIFDGQNFRYDSEASSKANSIEVGGRNLLLGTATPLELSIGYLNPYQISSTIPNLNANDILTFSFDAKATISRWIDFYWTNTASSTGGTSYNNTNNFYPSFQLSTDWAHYTYTGVVGVNVANILGIRMRQSTSSHGTSATGCTVYLKNVKLEKGNKATDWTPAPEDVTEYTDNQVEAVQNNLDNLKIGGRNLLLWTGDLPKGTDTSINGKDGIAAWGSANNLLSETDDGIKLTAATNSQECIGIPLANNGSVSNNERVLLTFEARGNITSVGQFYWLQSSGANVAKSSWINGSSSIVLSETEWTKFTVDVTDSQANIRTCTRILLFYNLGSANNGKWVELRKKSVKLEKGTKATDWTPAPEDIAADISTAQTTADNATPKADAIKRTQRIYYRSNSATAPSTPGTASSNWVTKSDDGTGVWTKMHVAISSTHKYVYTCEQYQFANETVGYTTVLRDNTITVIDGGNIITGSVMANKLNAVDINASNSLTIGALSTSTQNNILNSNVVVGGRNLLLDSANRTKWQVDEPTSYCIATIEFSENLVKGEQYTLQVWGTVERSDKDNSAIFNAYWGGGNVALGAMTPDAERSYWTLTFTAPNTTHATADNAWLNLYNTVPAGASGTTYSSNILKVKLERGNRLTDWTPAPEDVQSDVDSKADQSTVNDMSFDLYGRAADEDEGVEAIESIFEKISNASREAIEHADSIEKDIKGNFAETLEDYVTNEAYSSDVTDLNNTIKNSISKLSADVDQEYGSTKETIKKISGYIRITDDPLLELGSNDANAKVAARLTNTELDFDVENAGTVAYIGTDGEGGIMGVTRANIGELNIGNNWQFQQRANGHLSLKHISLE